jgi:AcrR family transcriptional regulator
MPLPRFERLPQARQDALLDVAQRHLAGAGRSGASYNQIIAEAGLSKTSAYLYFDGREDLVSAVVARVLRRLVAVLGPWTPVGDVSAFWRQLSTQRAALQRHLATHPEELAIVAQLEVTPWPQAEAWLEAMVENGRALGLVRREVPREVMAKVTRAVLTAIDGVAVEALRAGTPFDGSLSESLLGGLWRGGRS